MLWAYQVWTAYGLLFDTVLNAFYAVMAIVGFWRWFMAGRIRESAVAVTPPLLVTRMSLRHHTLCIGLGLLLSGALWVLAKAYTTAELPGPDAVTTVFSILATFLLIERKLENWLYLLVMDLAYVLIYFERGSIVFAGTFILYAVLAIVGYRTWLGELTSRRAL